MTIADSVWLATALLHRENERASDFSVQQIIEKVRAAHFFDSYRPGLPVFASKHCVANKAPNPLRHRILIETTRGRRRLFRQGDTFHPDRKGGKIRPERADLPAQYQSLVDWYDENYSKQPGRGAAGAAARVTLPHQFPSMEDFPHAFDELRSTTAFVGHGGTVVLPAYLQRELALSEGSCLSIYRDNNRIVLLPITEEFVRKLRGSCKGDDSMVEAREREHRDERY